MKNSIIYYFYCTCVPKKKCSSSDALTLFTASQFYCCWCGFFSSWIFSLPQRVSFFMCTEQRQQRRRKNCFFRLYTDITFLFIIEGWGWEIYVSPYNPNSTLILSTNIHLSYIHSTFMTLNPSIPSIETFLMDNSWLMEVKATLQQLIEKKEIFNSAEMAVHSIYTRRVIWNIHNQLS